VPEEFAAGLAPLLDRGLPQKAWIKKVFEGRVALVPIIKAEIFPEGAQVDGTKISQETISGARASEKPMPVPSGDKPVQPLLKGCGCAAGSGVVNIAFRALSLF
jgi:hypothetical protein